MSASIGVMMLGDHARRMSTSQTHASTEKIDVTQYTLRSSILRTSDAGIATTQTAMITSMLNAAEPTIVDGPSSPDRIPRPQISITESRISGADEPSAISVRLATVSFHTLTRKRRVVPSMICFTVYVHRCHLLDRGHEDVGDDRDAEEGIQSRQQ